MIICTACSSPYKIIENGVPLEERFKADGEPYKLWMSDLFRCACGNEIAVTGVGQGPIAEHFETDYAEARNKFPPRIVVPV